MQKGAIVGEAYALSGEAPAPSARLQGAHELLRGGGDEMDGPALGHHCDDVGAGRGLNDGEAALRAPLQPWQRAYGARVQIED